MVELRTWTWQRLACWHYGYILSYSKGFTHGRREPSNLPKSGWGATLARAHAPRLELSYVSKAISRTLQSPTQDDYAQLKHAIRYLKGTENFRAPMRPNVTTSCNVVFDATTFADAAWAG